MALSNCGLWYFTRSVLLTIVFLGLLVAPADAFVRHLCFNPLGHARIDPIVSPNKPSQHLHHLHGSSNLGLDSTDASFLLEGNCTSCSITLDKSGYWAPAMYFQHDNGTFELVSTASAITIYYKFEKRVNFEHQNYTVFPEGFRMVAGNSSKRTWNGPWPVPPQSIWGPADTTQEAIGEKALGFNCLNYQTAPEPSLAYPFLRNKAFTDANCADGIRAELLFPSCWDGVNLDSPDHKSHVAYPNLIQDGACPDSHPVFLPVLFYETIWNTQQFSGIQGEYVFANGDPTGYGYHGDFLAAWQDGILQKMVDDPSCTDHDLNHRVTDGIQEHCNVVASYIQSEEVAAKCKLDIPNVLRSEQVHGPLDMLPGNMHVTGVRHDPGTHQEDLSSATVSSAVSSLMSSAQVSEPAYPTASVISTGTKTETGTTIVPSLAPSKSADLMLLSTSVYTSDGTYVELIIAEEIVTTTVTATPTASVIARHVHGGHGHGHRNHV